jgi:hypothetical protein
VLKIYTQKYENEEQGAVVTARTSRSPNTFDVIDEEVAEKGHEQFLKTNVLGYGHDSVAEDAVTPRVRIEDVSDIAANVVALADPQLTVQMTSTRYQDMAVRPCYGQDRVPSAEGEKAKSRYRETMPVIEAILEKTDHPKKRTLQCDIARAHLPAGISTQVSIRGNARVMRDAVAFMLGHTLPEVQSVGRGVQEVIKQDIEVLFDRHVTPAPSKVYLMSTCGAESLYPLGYGQFVGREWEGDHKWVANDEAIEELKAWRDSGWRRRHRINASPLGPFWKAILSSDYGAYRDLRRNRTIHQTDALPWAGFTPDDPLWAFRELYPDVCKQIDKEVDTEHWYPDQFSNDPYVAPMGSWMVWSAGGHILNWAYEMRLRSWADSKNPKAGCHPAYAIPTRNLMKQVVDNAPLVAEAMGIVASPASFMGVEFTDRVP